MAEKSGAPLVEVLLVNTPAMAAKWNAPDGAMDDLFSVDADAHLQKLAACMFPSPAQLPVELVRAALKRKAAVINVQIQRRRLFIGDNGNGISADQWRDLVCAFDASRTAAERENAMAALQSAAVPGIGLLAIFVPGAKNILIENAGSWGKMAINLESGKVRQIPSSPLSRGTRITISRRGGPAAAEIKLLRELCAAVPQDITLNNKKLEKKDLLRRTLARKMVDLGQDGHLAQVAVPDHGDVCRFWLLDQGIPWQALTSAAYHGLIFAAALETSSPPPEPLFDRLASGAAQLYQWLASHYLSFPEKYQERIEELLFKKARLGGDLHLPSEFTPFRLWRCQRPLNLEEVRRKAEQNILYALPHDSDPSLFLNRHQEALLLTPLQQDFLLNHLNLPLVVPALPMGSKRRLAGMFGAAWRKMIHRIPSLPRRQPKVLGDEQLSNEEKQLCRELENYWQLTQLRDNPNAPVVPLAVTMIAGRGLTPSFWLPATRGFTLQLRRRHPLVALAVRRVSCDSANAELAFAALTANDF
jgi:hypothetical protein